MKDEERPELRGRLKAFAVAVIRLCAKLPRTPAAQVIGRQLLRSGTSPGAHYCEGRRAKSDADLISKVEGALQELEECAYWLELLVEADILGTEDVRGLHAEAHELMAVLVTVVLKVKGRSGR